MSTGPTAAVVEASRRSSADPSVRLGAPAPGGSVSVRGSSGRGRRPHTALAGVLAARREAAAGDQVGDVGRLPSIDSSTHRSRRAPGWPRAGPACTGAAGRRRRRATGPSSTTWLEYITATRSQTWRTTSRSWATSSSAKPVVVLQLAQQLQVARLRRRVERRRRLVGDEQAGLAGQRDGAGHPLAHAAAELVRELAQPLLGRAGRWTWLERLDERLVERRPAEPAMLAQRLGELAADGERRVERRHAGPASPSPSACRGCAAAASASSASEVLALEQDRARSRPRAAGGSRPMIARLVIVLPEPDSPTRPSRLAGVDREADVVARRHSRVRPARRDADREVRDLEDRCPELITDQRCRVLGSKWSRSQSPRVLQDSTVDGDGEAREQRDPPAGGDQGPPSAIMTPHDGCRRRDAGAEEAQRRLGQDHAADLQGGRRRAASAARWEHVAQTTMAQSARRSRIGYRTKSRLLRTSVSPRMSRAMSRPDQQPEHEDEVLERRSDGDGDDERDEERRQRQHDVDESHQHRVDPAADVAGGDADEGADRRPRSPAPAAATDSDTRAP